jgi:hypothetical protein
MWLNGSLWLKLAAKLRRVGLYTLHLLVHQLVRDRLAIGQIKTSGRLKLPFARPLEQITAAARAR